MLKQSVQKFRGCLVGALVGDCLGYSYEGEALVNQQQLQRYFNKLEGPPFKSPAYKYTDDTAMTKQVAISLIEKNGFDPMDMASRFVKEYYNDPARGYGKRVIEVFSKLNSQNMSDIWAPAREQFGGSGSYGNGGAMRISPVPLFYSQNYQQMLEVATKVTELTHTHPLGVAGALLQAVAVYQALHLDVNQPLDTTKFINDLKTKMEPIEQKLQRVVPEKVTYIEQLKEVEKLLKLDNVSIDEVVDKLGNSISAIYSVPTAVYCFLRAQKPIPHIETKNPVSRTIQYAISLGGDTDTIASMAGAIAGSFYGIEVINQNVWKMCEDAENIDKLAVAIHNSAAAAYS